MKTWILLCLPVIVCSQVIVRKGVEGNPVTGVTTENVILMSRDRHRGDNETPAFFGVTCRQKQVTEDHSGDAEKFVILVLDLGDKARFLVKKEERFPTVYADRFISVVHTLLRFDEEQSQRDITWTEESDRPGHLFTYHEKLIQDTLKSKLIHVQIELVGSGKKTFSFDLTGLGEEYHKHDQCKQLPSSR